MQWRIPFEFARDVGFEWGGSLQLVVLVDSPLQIVHNWIPADTRPVREGHISVDANDLFLTNEIFSTCAVSHEVWSIAKVVNEGGRVVVVGAMH